MPKKIGLELPIIILKARLREGRANLYFLIHSASCNVERGESLRQDIWQLKKAIKILEEADD